MQVDLSGRVRNTSLLRSKSLLPLFDAVINAIHAIEDGRPPRGEVRVIVERETRNTPLFAQDGVPRTDVTGFIVVDNGIGFDDENYKSFDTSDSTWKQARGAKGVGRLLWLKAFRDIRIASTFRDKGQIKQRRFAFRLPQGIDEHTCEDAREGQATGTTVTLRDLDDAYCKSYPQHSEIIADRIIDHCLVYFLGANCPTILLADGEARIVLNERFRQQVHDAGASSSYEVNGASFTVRHLHVPGATSKHRIVYCAHLREVSSEAPSLPDLKRRLHDHQGEPFSIVSCVSGELLDRAVNQERTGFHLPENGTVLPGDVTLDLLREATVGEMAKHLAPFLEPVRQQKLAEIERFINEDAPHYRPLIARREDLLRIPPGLEPYKLDIELHKIKARIEVDTKERVAALLRREATDDDEYRQKYEAVLAQVNELGKSALTEHVVHRKTVLEIFARRLGLRHTGKYAIESDVHRIIFPLRATSDEIAFEQQNLWIIDERLTFHRYLASDKPLADLAPVTTAARERPDIVIWNNPFSLSEDEAPPLNAVTIIEFKRPQRADYPEDDDPLSQVYGYVRKIQAGTARDPAGRPITVRDTTPFYIYIIADFTKPFRERIENFAFTVTPDGLGYFNFNKNLMAYVEILSYDKVIADARRRNRAFFEKLQLPTSGG